MIGVARFSPDYKKHKGVRVEVPPGFILRGCPFCGAEWPSANKVQAGRMLRCQICFGKVAGEQFRFPRFVKLRDRW